MAFNPANGGLYVLNSKNDVYEFNKLGTVVSTRRLSSVGITNATALVFTPSANRFDDPSVMTLFVLEASLPPGGPGGKPAPRIVELSLTAPILAPSTLAAPVVDPVPTLIQTIQTWQWSIPSPDPDGITYIPSCPGLIAPAAGSYLVNDSEVEEANFVSNGIWKGYNIYEMSPSGTPLHTYTTYPKF